MIRFLTDMIENWRKKRRLKWALNQAIVKVIYKRSGEGGTLPPNKEKNIYKKVGIIEVLLPEVQDVGTIWLHSLFISDKKLLDERLSSRWGIQVNKGLKFYRSMKCYVSRDSWDEIKEDAEKKVDEILSKLKEVVHENLNKKENPPESEMYRLSEVMEENNE